MCARISTYPRDTFVSGLDKWIGTDANTENLATKNFTANAVADYFNRSAIIDTGQFSWQYAPYSNTQPQAEKSFQQINQVNESISILSLATAPLRVSALTLANTTPKIFITNEWVGKSILVHVPSGPSQYAIYTVKTITPDTEWFFLLELEFVSGSSGTILKGDPLVFGYFGGANMVTQVTGTFPIIVTGTDEPVVSIDVTTKNNWNTAYNRSLVSAAVTGTTTKTLTLNKQDGGTITASWTDDNTNLVTSVFGRTGAIAAQSGDYTTTLVTEGSNLYFTTARARGAVSAATPLLYNSTTGVFSIQLSSATQSGYLSSTDWTTFNSKESFVTPGTTYQYWRGDKTWQNLTTTPVAEGTNLYFTDQRARNVISSSITGIDYSNTTGIFSLTSGYFIPTTSQSDQWNTAYNRSITSAAVTGTTTKTLTLNKQDGGTITASWTDDNSNLVTSVFGRTGAVAAQSGDYTTTLVTEGDNLYFTTARARGAISLTTTGTSGPATYSSSTGVLNIPQYQGGVTSFNTRTGAITLTSQDVTDALGFTPENVSNKSNNTALGTSATLYPTQNAVKTYVDSATAGGIILQGDWNAATNVPDITATTQTGFAWRVSVAGNTNLGGITDWQVNDLAVKSATGWIKLDNTESVTSVFGRFGTVVAQSGDYNTDLVTEGTTNLYFTTARARASISAGSGIAYNSTTGVISSTSGGGSVTSVGLSMPSAFTVTNSPITGAGTLTVTGAGTTAQYIRGDGSLATLPGTSTEARSLIREVYNKTGATLTKGTVVYINDGQGNLPAVTKAIATGDMTSAQTFGVVQSDITDQNNGFVIVAGGLENLDTNGLGVGTQLYLSSTVAGAYTTVKQYAPAHLVYVAIVVRDHPTQGVIEVNIQNGYELDELHNVSARNPANNDIIAYNTTTSLWEKKSIATTLGYTPANAATTLTINGTGYDLSSNRTWSVGTVTSVGLALGTSGTDANISNSPITSTGEITLNLPTASATNRGLLSNGDWTTFNSKQTLLNGNGFVKMSETTVSYITGTSSQFVKADGTLDSNAYLPLSGGTLTGPLGGTSASFSGAVTSTLAYSNTSDLSFVASANIPGLNLRSSAGGRLSIVTGYIGADISSILVGTGTNNPSTEALRIAHSNGAAIFSNSIQATRLSLNNTGTAARLQVNGVNSEPIAYLYNNSGSAGNVPGVAIEAGTNSSDYALAVGSSLGTPYLRVRGDGNVGIGTTSPQTLLSIETSGTQNTVSPIITSQSSGTTYTGMYSIRDGAGDQRGLIFQVYTANVGLNEKMRVTSGGNVLIGTTSSTASVFTLQVGSGSTDTRAFFNPSNAFAIGVANGGSSVWYMGVNAQTAANGLQFYSNELGAAAMTIRTTGNVGIGTTTPASLLNIYGSGTPTFVLSNADTTADGSHNVTIGAYKNGVGYNNLLLDAATYQFKISGTERMRITSGGDVGIGTSSIYFATGNRKCLEVNGAGTAIVALKIQDVPQGYLYSIGNNADFYLARVGTGGQLIVQNNTGGVYLGVGATAWSSISDIRLKNINSNIENALDSLMSLSTINFSWKSDSENKENLGLIAQEVESVFPQVISKSKFKGSADSQNTDETEYLGVRYTELVPVLIKAIQELKTELDTLKNK